MYNISYISLLPSFLYPGQYHRYHLLGGISMKCLGLRLSVLSCVIILLCLCTLVSCSSTEAQLTAKAITISLEGQSATTSGDGVSMTDGQVTITSHGIYRLSGSFEGQILVDCVDSGEVWLLLDGVTLHNASGACIYVKKADRTHLHLLSDTTSTLTDGTNYTFDPGDDEPNGAIFARDDLVLSGTGTLSIDAHFKFGIAAKDDLTLSGGHIQIDSVGHGIKGKDSLTITGGSISIVADGDGLKATNSDTGSILISGGTVDLFAGDEGIQAVSDVTITGGTVQVDSKNNGIRSGTMLTISGGTVSIQAEDDAIDAPETNHTGGTFVIDGVEQ